MVKSPECHCKSCDPDADPPLVIVPREYSDTTFDPREFDKALELHRQTQFRKLNREQRRALGKKKS